jgi:hypothetical protein
MQRSILGAYCPQPDSAWSLAWATLALAAYGRPIDSIHSLLVEMPDLSGVDDTSTLALICLALDPQRALSAFGATW